jgi:hypothetical protein
MIFGLCNPLLDVTAEVEVDFLKKYLLQQLSSIFVWNHVISIRIIKIRSEREYCNIRRRSK